MANSNCISKDSLIQMEKDMRKYYKKLGYEVQEMVFDSDKLVWNVVLKPPRPPSSIKIELSITENGVEVVHPKK